MATTAITINIDNSLITETVNALCASGNYQDTITDANGQSVANPVTKAVFAKQVVRDYIRGIVIEQRKQAAILAAQSIDPALIS